MKQEEFKELLDNMSDEEFLKKVDEIEQLGDTGHTIDEYCDFLKKNVDKNAALIVGYSCFLQSPFGLGLSIESEEYKKKMQEFEKNLEEGNGGISYGKD